MSAGTETVVPQRSSYWLWPAGFFGVFALVGLWGRANSLPVAFQASVFARDIGAALHAADRLDASAVMINDHTAFRTDWMPFAGRRQSGYGSAASPSACAR